MSDAFRHDGLPFAEKASFFIRGDTQPAGGNHYFLKGRAVIAAMQQPISKQPCRQPILGNQSPETLIMAFVDVVSFANAVQLFPCEIAFPFRPDRIHFPVL
ncbi:MAG: hypothetical protein ABFC77_12035 [Thermoguttaceae bacterium]